MPRGIQAPSSSSDEEDSDDVPFQTNRQSQEQSRPPQSHVNTSQRLQNSSLLNSGAEDFGNISRNLRGKRRGNVRSEDSFDDEEDDDLLENMAEQERAREQRDVSLNQSRYQDMSQIQSQPHTTVLPGMLNLDASRIHLRKRGFAANTEASEAQQQPGNLPNVSSSHPSSSLYQQQQYSLPKTHRHDENHLNNSTYEATGTHKQSQQRIQKYEEHLTHQKQIIHSAETKQSSHSIAPASIVRAYDLDLTEVNFLF